jgi:hypothetical protein
VSLQTIRLLLPPACRHHYCRPTSGHIDRRAFSRGWLTRDRRAWLALLVHAQGCLELRHRFRSREGTALARVALQFLARSIRRAGYMTCGPGPPCRTRRSRKGAPPWCSCMPPAWRSALSPAGLGEDGRMLVTAGRLHAPRAAVWSSVLGQLACHVGPSPRVIGGRPWSVLVKTQFATAEDASGESHL